MDLRIDPATIELHPGRPLRLRVGAGRQITNVRGTTWITVDGDLRDVVLEEGETHVFDRPGRVVVQSLGGDAQLVGEDGIEVAHDEPRSAAAEAMTGLWRDLRRIATTFRTHA